MTTFTLSGGVTFYVVTNARVRPDSRIVVTQIGGTAAQVVRVNTGTAGEFTVFFAAAANTAVIAWSIVF